MTAPPKTSVLGIGISRVAPDEAVALILDWARRRQSRVVSALAVHGVMTGVRDAEHGRRLNQFDMLAPDGQPVRWAANWLTPGERLRERVRGPELTRRICAAAAREGITVYLYGSRPEVVETMATRLRASHPGLEIAGIRASRFRPATPAEDADDVEAINQSGAGVVFVGLGCPLQERWAYEHAGRVRAVLVCVGAAFDFLAGRLAQAPRWMQTIGLEWLFRLAQEPRRLWRRYAYYNPLFLGLVLLQLAGLKTFPHVSR
jgi:N-acetylglucosaminyldiphosphoundecaprenol N-acetyl-beta-D-mannosaminyltransferase